MTRGFALAFKLAPILNRELIMANPKGKDPNDVYVGTFNFPADNIDRHFFKDKDNNFYVYNVAKSIFFPGHPFLYWSHKSNTSTNTLYWAQVIPAMQATLGAVKPLDVKQLYDNDTYIGVVPWHSSQWSNPSPYHFFKTGDNKFYYWCETCKPEFSGVFDLSKWKDEINYSPVFKDFWLAAIALMEKSMPIEAISNKCCCLVGPDMHARYHSNYCGMYGQI